MKLISFVFSFRNEEKNLKNLITRVDEVVKKKENWKYELVFVNDDSSDESEKVLLNLQKEFCQTSKFQVLVDNLVDIKFRQFPCGPTLPVPSSLQFPASCFAQKSQ